MRLVHSDWRVVFHTSYNAAMAENLEVHDMAGYDGSEATPSVHESGVIGDRSISHQYSAPAIKFQLRFTLPTRWLQKIEHLMIAVLKVSTAGRRLNHASIPKAFLGHWSFTTPTRSD